MIQAEKTSRKRVAIGRKAIGIGFIFLLGGVFPLGLNFAVYWKLKHDLPFEFRGDISSFLPGKLSLNNFRIEKDRVFEGRARILEFEYRPLEFLLRGRLNLSATAESMSVQIPGLGAKEFSAVGFHSLKTFLQIDPRGAAEIRYFFAASDDCIIYMGGGFSKDKLDVNVSCFLTPGLVTKLPPFVSEHLFASKDTLFRQIQFKTEGTWKHPYFSLSSDLARLELKSREAG